MMHSLKIVMHVQGLHFQKNHPKNRYIQLHFRLFSSGFCLVSFLVFKCSLIKLNFTDAFHLITHSNHSTRVCPFVCVCVCFGCERQIPLLSLFILRMKDIIHTMSQHMSTFMFRAFRTAFPFSIIRMNYGTVHFCMVSEQKKTRSF